MTYSKERVAALKRAMRAAAPNDYRFTEDVVAALCTETGLTPEQIRLWAKELDYYDTDAQKKRYLDEEKVSFNSTKGCKNASG